jgi:hypothetical protein
MLIACASRYLFLIVENCLRFLRNEKSNGKRGAAN